jgi:hypothetical protein
MSRDTGRVWSMPAEPEKKTSWKDDIAKEPKMEMRDTEAERAAKRTRLILERMSPPGKLGLPPLLEAARWKWGIPDGAFACQAVFDRIHIFPIDLFENADRIPGTNLFRPTVSKLKDEQNGHRGVLLSMGLSALDQCSSHGVELGHVVRTIRNAPHAQECERMEDFSVFYLVMRAGDLTGSETQRAQLMAGETSIVDDGGEHSYSFNIEGKKKIVAHIRDQW